MLPTSEQHFYGILLAHTSPVNPIKCLYSFQYSSTDGTRNKKSRYDSRRLPDPVRVPGSLTTSAGEFQKYIWTGILWSHVTGKNLRTQWRNVASLYEAISEINKNANKNYILPVQTKRTSNRQNKAQSFHKNKQWSYWMERKKANQKPEKIWGPVKRERESMWTEKKKI